MKGYIQIRDEHSILFGYRVLNSHLSLYIGIVQLFVCFWSIAQHLYSLVVFGKILHCDFGTNSTLLPALTAVDAIIFDIGLFHNLWGIPSCVAEYLDGGYGRFAWCISHTACLFYCLPFVFFLRPRPCHLWPLLIQQSAYGIGMLILSLAALPRVLPMFMGTSSAPVHAILFYSFGTFMNFFLLYIYWHWYWHVEASWNAEMKLHHDQVQRNHNIRTAHIVQPPPNNCVTPRQGPNSTLPNSHHQPFSNSVCNPTVKIKITPRLANGPAEEASHKLSGQNSPLINKISENPQAKSGSFESATSGWSSRKESPASTSLSFSSASVPSRLIKKDQQLPSFRASDINANSQILSPRIIRLRNQKQPYHVSNEKISHKKPSHRLVSTESTSREQVDEERRRINERRSKEGVGRIPSRGQPRRLTYSGKSKLQEMRRMHLSVEQHRQPQSPEPIIPMVMSSPSPLKCSLATSVASRIFPESHPYRRKHTEQQGYERPPNFGAYYQDDVRPGSTISSARTLRAFTPPITYGQLRSKALTPLLPYTQQQCYGGEANGHLVYLSQNFSSLSSPVQSRHAINPYFAAVQPPTHGLVNRWYQTQAESSSFLPTNKFDNHSITGLWPSAITTQRRLDKRLFFNSSDNKGNFPITQL